MRDLFNEHLQLPVSDLTWELEAAKSFAADDLDYLVNPRRLRGSDFLMRWSQGRWSEEVVIRAIGQTKQFGAIAYGPSTVASAQCVTLNLCRRPSWTRTERS